VDKFLPLAFFLQVPNVLALVAILAIISHKGGFVRSKGVLDLFAHRQGLPCSRITFGYPSMIVAMPHTYSTCLVHE
jgi:hypothetical protein